MSGTSPIGGVSSSASLAFNVTFGTGYSVVGAGAVTTTPAPGTQASGSLSAGASTIQYSTSVLSGSGGNIVNGASSPTAVSSNPSVSVSVTRAGSSPVTIDTVIAVTAVIRNSGGSIISTTAFNLHVTGTYT